jgi:uroporphyrinogen decarboxylase
MNARQRVLAVLDRQPVDRPPVDLWYTGEVLQSLFEATGTSTEPDLWRALGVDKLVWLSPDYRGALRPLDHGAEMATPWGSLLRRVQSGAAEYLEYTHPPLAGMEEPEELDAYPWWPDPDAYDLEPLFRQLDAVGDEFVTLGPWVSLFEIVCAMRGMEDAMVDLCANPEFADAVLDRVERVQTRLMERILTEHARRPDLVFVSDDMGSQSNLFISPETWKRHIGPRLRRWCDLIHRHGARVFYHSDGAVESLVPLLIDAGIDILNPLQHRCPGMELDGLRAKYGDRLVFHGGVDTQGVLPFGTPEDVRRETRHCLDTLRGAPFICCSCHNIQSGTPVENIRAMIAEVHRG